MSVEQRLQEFYLHLIDWVESRHAAGITLRAAIEACYACLQGPLSAATRQLVVELITALQDEKKNLVPAEVIELPNEESPLSAQQQGRVVGATVIELQNEDVALEEAAPRATSTPEPTAEECWQQRWDDHGRKMKALKEEWIKLQRSFETVFREADELIRSNPTQTRTLARKNMVADGRAGIAAFKQAVRQQRKQREIERVRLEEERARQAAEERLRVEAERRAEEERVRREATIKAAEEALLEATRLRAEAERRDQRARKALRKAGGDPVYHFVITVATRANVRVIVHAYESTTSSSARQPDGEDYRSNGWAV